MTPLDARRGPAGPRRRGSRHAVKTVLVAAFVLAQPLAAQLSIDRLSVNLNAEAGTVVPAVVTVRNTADAPVQATIHLEDWDRAEDGTNRWHAPGSVPGACADRLEVFPRALLLEPGSSQSLRITFSSTEALTRGCWGAVIVGTTGPPVEGTGIRMTVRTAIKVYVPPVAPREEVEVVAIEVARPSPGGEASETASPSEVRVTFENTGNVHVVSRATLQVRSADNVVVHELDFPPSYLLPGARGRVSVPLPDLESGRYVLLALADYDGPELAAALVEHEVR